MISARTAVDVYRIEATDPVPHGKLDFLPRSDIQDGKGWNILVTLGMWIGG
jgi:hypothetical protein